MDQLAGDAAFVELEASISSLIAPYRGRADYGCLRMRVSEWDNGAGDPIRNIALAYETPEGSTDQINVLYLHDQGLFEYVDLVEGEVTTPSPEVVLQMIRRRIEQIPHPA